MRKLWIGIAILAVLLAGATSLLAYPATVTPAKAEKLARRFVFERLRGPDGALLAHGKVRRLLLFPTYDPDDLLASGVLSETVGLAMQYALLTGDRSLFDEQLQYLRKNMLGQLGLFFWKISHDTELNASSSASVDDLRIVGACLSAQRLWGGQEYLAFARDIADNIRRYEVVDNVLRDYLNWRDYGDPTVADSLQLSYADAITLRMLAEDNPDWAPVLAATGGVLLGGRSESGLFYEKYNFSKRQYEGESQNMINQLYSAIFAYPLEQDRHPFYEWLKRAFAEDGSLFAEYDIQTGEATRFFESTSVYALAARYARQAGDRTLSEQLIDKLMDFQNLNPLSPMYGGFCDDEVYSFDNLEALISLRLHNAGQ